MIHELSPTVESKSKTTRCNTLIVSHGRDLLLTDGILSLHQFPNFIMETGSGTSNAMNRNPHAYDV